MLPDPNPFPRRRALGALAVACLAVLVFSYLLTLAIALTCLALPVLRVSSGAINLLSVLPGDFVVTAWGGGR